jgi:hypothetical protein
MPNIAAQQVIIKVRIIIWRVIFFTPGAVEGVTGVMGKQVTFRLQAGDLSHN